MLARRGRLIAHVPELEVGDACRRRLWLHPEVSKWALAKGEDRKQQRYFEGVRDFLRNFVIGEDFDNEALLKPLKTSLGAWYEFRILFAPHHRIIGGFLRTGEFLALTHGTRQDLDKNFAPSIRRANEIWKSLSLDAQPLTGERVDLLEDFHYDEA